MMEQKQLFELTDGLKAGIGEMDASSFIEVDSLTMKILSHYQTVIESQMVALKAAEKRKGNELDAFRIGDAIADGICLVDQDGVVIAINKGYTTITEIKEEEILGKNLKELRENKHFQDPVSQLVLEQKKKITAVATIHRNNKSVMITGNPFFNEEGEVIQIMTVMRDMTELIKLKNRLERTEETNQKYRSELNYFRQRLMEDTNLIGESPSMKVIKELIGYIAKSEATILIIGETGSGKEVVSKEIHEKSNRSGDPYIKVNCAAIPDSLMESEMFGYEKGAFTGAQSKEKLGMFEMANGGTILLDEIGEMPLALQPKLLRVLQEKELFRVGGNKSIKLDVRVIAASNQHLDKLVEEGRFREDLYYRLNVVPIRIPALRDRLEDIVLLSNKFLSRFNAKYGKEKSFDNDAVLALEDYRWPGNVRELQNVIERLVVINDEALITYEQIGNILGTVKSTSKIQFGDENFSLKDAVDAFERDIIEKALRKHGSTYKAAKALCLTQPTVFRKAKALGIKLKSES